MTLAQSCSSEALELSLLLFLLLHLPQLEVSLLLLLPQLEHSLLRLLLLFLLLLLPQLEVSLLAAQLEPVQASSAYADVC